MKKINSIFKNIFQIVNLILIILYLYPGSILGWFFYGNIKKQPQITSDFIISLNHFYAFFILTFLGVLAYRGSEKINLLKKYVFLLSILLELLHFVIPERSFQLSDLSGNIFGFAVIFFLFKIFKKN